MYCPHCGKPYDQSIGATFCQYCGGQINGARSEYVSEQNGHNYSPAQTEKAKISMKGVVAIVGILLTLIIAVAAVHVYSTIQENKSYIGEYYTYDITGSGNGYTFTGTQTMKIVDANYSSVKVEYKTSMYRSLSYGSQIPLYIPTVYEWVPVNDNASWGAFQGTENITTKWGSKTVSVYLETDSDGTYRYYVGNDGIAYRMISTSGGVTLTYNLSEYLLKG